MNEQIEVITYEQDRLNYFTDLMNKSQKTYKRLFAKFKNAPYLSAEAQALSDAGRETNFLGDVVEMLGKGYRKQSEGEWEEMGQDYANCSICGTTFEALPTLYAFKRNNIYCRHCGAKMK